MYPEIRDVESNVVELYPSDYSGLATSDLVDLVQPHLPRLSEKQISNQSLENRQIQHSTSGLGLLAELADLPVRRVWELWQGTSLCTTLTVADKLLLAVDERVPEELVIPIGRGQNPRSAARRMAIDEFVVDNGLDLRDPAPAVDEWWVERRTEELLARHHERTAERRAKPEYVAHKAREAEKARERRAALRVVREAA